MTRRCCLKVAGWGSGIWNHLGLRCCKLMPLPYADCLQQGKLQSMDRRPSLKSVYGCAIWGAPRGWLVVGLACAWAGPQSGQFTSTAPGPSQRSLSSVGCFVVARNSPDHYRVHLRPASFDYFYYYWDCYHYSPGSVRSQRRELEVRPLSSPSSQIATAVNASKCH
jgi:hypothetical protein